MLKETLKNKKGITLIALIITIIVLLILAGVTIAAITSNESAPNKAVEARQKNEEGAEYDAIKLAAVSSVAEGNYDLYIDVPTLRKGLTGLIKGDVNTVINENASEWKVEGNTGKHYKITNTGKVTVENWVYDQEKQTITDGTVTLKIGDYIKDTGNQTVSGFDGMWRVLGVENGQPLLITDTYYAPFEDNTQQGITSVPCGENVKGLLLIGAEGYNNGVNILDSIGAKYNNDKLENGRSVKIEDIDKITEYNPNNIGEKDPNQTGTGTPFGNNYINQYKNKVTYTLNNQTITYKGTDAVKTTQTAQATYNQFKLVGQSENITAPYTVNESTAYYYYPTTLTESEGSTSVGIQMNSVIYNMLFNAPYAPYWLSSTYIEAKDGNVQWGLRNVPINLIATCYLWDSNSGGSSGTYGVRPVVTLKSNVTPKLKSTDSSTNVSTYEI